MRRGHGGGGLGGELTDLAGGDALVDAGADLLGDEDGVAVLHAEAVAEPREPRGDLVEVDRLLPAVALHHVHLASPPPGLSGFPSNTPGAPRPALMARVWEGNGERGSERFKCLEKSVTAT